MRTTELELLQYDVQQAKRIADEKTAILKDLVENQLPASFERIPRASRECFEACQHWTYLNHELEQAKISFAN